MSNIIKNINKEQLETLINSLKDDNAIYLKFTANWCGPCKNIKPYSDNLVKLCSNNIICIEIDVDESVELYAFFKKYKLLKGIPAMFLYYGDQRANHDKWFYPDYSVLGSKLDEFKILETNLTKYIKLTEEQG